MHIYSHSRFQVSFSVFFFKCAGRRGGLPLASPEVVWNVERCPSSCVRRGGECGVIGGSIEK